MFAPLNPKGMGPMTPPLTLALTSLMGMPSRFHCCVRHKPNPTPDHLHPSIHRLW